MCNKYCIVLDHSILIVVTYYLILMRVEDVAAQAACTVFLASKDQDVCLRDWTCTKPVLDVRLQTTRPYFDQFPKGWLVIVHGVKSLNVCN